MNIHFQILEISLKDIFLGEDGLGFIPEVVIRAMIMYIILFLGLKAAGKRGIKQLSVFELIIILGLGSAAGDPMFYKEVGIMHAIIVFTVIILLYRITTLALSFSPKLEELLEGTPVYIVENGLFCIENTQKKLLGEDEFLSELRKEKITQLGQIKYAILETDGNMSVIFKEDEEVDFGLPILPREHNLKLDLIKEDGIYACHFCGYTTKLQTKGKVDCTRCGKDIWVKAQNEKRIT